MATVLKAGNTTTGGTFTPDSTGILEIKTGTGTGTTAMTLDASQNVVIAGTLTASGGFVGGGGNYVLTAATATGPGTWTKPAGLKAIKVTVVGGGGSGGPAPGAAAGGSGGGGGGATIRYIIAPAISGPVAYTVGTGGTTPAAGGTSSFGPWNPASPAPTVTISATGGGAGAGASVGGSGGTGSGGSLNITGGGGGAGYQNPAWPGIGGTGGSSIFGGGGRGTYTSTPTAGQVGGAYGGGGGGGQAYSSGTAVGGNGAQGVIIVEEFY